MKNLFVIIFFIFYCYDLSAQNKKEKISIEFKDSSTIDVLNKIENLTKYKFFYVDKWFDKQLISGNYKNALLTDVLDRIFEETHINYYISSDNRIILTPLVAIYDTFPKGFFKRAEKKSQREVDENLSVKTEAIKTKEERILTDIETTKVEENIKKRDPEPIITEKDIEITEVKPIKTEIDTIKTIVKSDELNRRDTVKKPIVRKIEINKEGIETLKVGKESKIGTKDTYTLTGYVKHEINGNPIPNLVISVIGKNRNAVTENNGFYTITLDAGENYLKMQSLGIIGVTKRVIMYNDGSLDFYLQEDTESLDEIVLDVDKISNIRNPATGITKIEVAKIKNIPMVLGERDILRVATTLPGISTVGEGSSGFNVRGGKEDQNLILLDDGVIYNPTHFFGIFTALNPFTTGDVTIYKGSVPAEYGGRLSSVFDIKTKDGDTNKVAGEASIGPVTANVTLEIPVVKGASSVLVGGRATYSDWLLKTLDNESLNNSRASFYDVILKYNHKLNKTDNLYATAYYSKDAYSITSDSLFSYSNRMFSLRWNKEFNEKNRASFILANSEYKFDIDYNGDSNTNFDIAYRVVETHLKAQMKYYYNEKHTFNYGISSKLYVVNPGSLSPKGNTSIIEPLRVQEDRALESALFVSDNFKVNDKISLNAGIRYSFFLGLGPSVQNEYLPNLPKNESTLVRETGYANNEVYQTYGGPEFRISARYLLSPTASIKVGYNNAFQYIHTLTNNTTLAPTDTWKLSDSNIKPQQSSQFSAGIFKNSDNNMYEFSVEGYYKELKNMLDFKVGADLLLNENIETEVLQGDGRAYGIEFLVRKTKGKFNGWLSYSYARSLIRLDSEFNEERINNGNFFPSNFDKPHDLSIVSNYKLTKRFSFSANFIYQTGRPVTYPVGNFIYNGVEYVTYSDRNQFRIPDFYRLDIGFNIEGNHKIKKLAHSFWNISIYNVLGRNNPYSVFFVTENGEIKAYKSTIFSVPVPTITYNIRF